MPKQLIDEQKARLKAALEAEPTLFNARHYLNHPVHRDHSLLTMACWLNEVGGKEIATPEMVADVLGIRPPGAQPEPPKQEPAVDVWKEQRAALGDVIQ